MVKANWKSKSNQNRSSPLRKRVDAFRFYRSMQNHFYMLHSLMEKVMSTDSGIMLAEMPAICLHRKEIGGISRNLA